jgi:cysteine desulfurase
MKLPVYMDHHATTPVDPRVLEAMFPFFSEKFGNAASRNHPFGWAAHEAVEAARAQIAASIGAAPEEIIFTSGATESNNLALTGILPPDAKTEPHIITTAIEHSSVLDTTRHLERSGIAVTYLPAGSEGIIDPHDVEEAITARTILISVMCANNEIGTLQPIRAIGEIARAHKIPFHTDAAQAIGKIPVDVDADHIDLLSMSAHKTYGPKGIGALYVRRRKPRIRLTPLIHGGGHERGMRSGTLPVPQIVGFGRAAEIAVSERVQEASRVAALRDRLMTQIMDKLDGVSINGSIRHRLPNNLNLSFMGVDGESVLLALKDIALSTGSACSTAEPEASHVLKALGLPPDRLKSSIRFGLGRFNTEEEVDYVAQNLIDAIKNLRKLSPRHNMTTQPTRSSVQ